MSTSPSWFDQEKFSRLVKKVGPKAPVATPAAGSRVMPPQPPEKETRRLQRSLIGAGPLPEPVKEKPAPEVATPEPPPTVLDAPIRAAPPESAAKEGDLSLSQFPPPMPLPEPRSVSPLSRRTTPLPSLKSIFEYEKPANRAGAAAPPLDPIEPVPFSIPPATEEESPSAKESEVPGIPAAPIPDQPEFPGISAASADFPAWPKFPAPEEISAKVDDEKSADSRDELAALKKEKDELAGRVEELSRAAGDRDDARAEIELLRTQLQQADEILQATGTPGNQLEDLTRTIEERDAARRDYAKLREDFENLKKEQARSRTGFLKEAGFAPAEAPSTPDSEKQEELARLKTTVAGLESSLAAMKRESDAMQKQIAQSRDETSVAQRGLALSQKALQETRDALREASEGTSQSKANAEKLKGECASLVQQNLALQSRIEQISRELNSAKGTVADRG